MEPEEYESPATVALEEALAHVIAIQHDTALHLAHIRQALIAQHQAEQAREKVRRHRARMRATQSGAALSRDAA